MNTAAHALNVWLIRQGLATTDPYLADRPAGSHSYWPADRRAQRTRDIQRRLAADPSVIRIKRSELSRHRPSTINSQPSTL